MYVRPASRATDSADSHVQAPKPQAEAISHWMRRHRKTARGPFLTVAAPAQESFWAGLRPGGQVTFRPVPARTAYSANGLSAWTPASSKSFTLRVTTEIGRAHV